MPVIDRCLPKPLFGHLVHAKMNLRLVNCLFNFGKSTTSSAESWQDRIIFWVNWQVETLETTKVNINIDGVTIKPIYYTYLEVHLDSRLDKHYLISKIVSTCFSPKTTVSSLHIVDCDGQHLVSALIFFATDFCIFVFASLPYATLASLLRVTNAAVRFIAGLGPHIHTHEFTVNCYGYWLNSTSHADYVIMHSVVTGTARNTSRTWSLWRPNLLGPVPTCAQILCHYTMFHVHEPSWVQKILCCWSKGMKQSSTVNARHFISHHLKTQQGNIH